MPDKHEVGGSSPLGPTSRTKQDNEPFKSVSGFSRAKREISFKGGSSPLGPTKQTCSLQKNGENYEPLLWGCSSAGRAPALQAGGHGFESHHLHQASQRLAIENEKLRMKNENKGKI